MLSCRFHVSTECRGSRFFKVTNCDLKRRAWHPSKISSLRLYRARHSNVIQRIAQLAGYTSKHRHHAHLRQAARTVGTNNALAGKLAVLERKYASRFKVVFAATRALMIPADRKRKTDRVYALGIPISEKRDRPIVGKIQWIKAVSQRTAPSGPCGGRRIDVSR